MLRMRTPQVEAKCPKCASETPHRLFIMEWDNLSAVNKNYMCSKCFFVREMPEHLKQHYKRKEKLKMRCNWWENSNPTYNNRPVRRCSDCRLSNLRGKYGCPLMGEPQMLLNESRKLVYLAATSQGWEEFDDKDTAIAAMRRDKANLV